MRTTYPTEHTDEHRTTGRPAVIVASCRAPLSPVGNAGRMTWEPGAGGLVRAIAPALGPGDVWVALGGEEAPPLSPEQQVSFSTRYVHVSRRTRRLYDVASNRVLWFAMHGHAPRALGVHDVIEAWEDGYRPANAAFAAALVDEWRTRRTPILIQDYQLFGCPQKVRELAPGARIQLFCHTPFLGPRALHPLPYFVIADVLRSVLSCDLVGFQSGRDLAGFIQACQTFLGAQLTDGALVWSGRRVHVDIFPAAVDAAQIRADARADCDRYAHVPDDDPVIVWAGRSDPVKNPLGAIAGFGRLLERDASLRGRARLVMKIHPSRQSLPEYHDCLLAVQDEAARLNADLATNGWVPVAVDMSSERAHLVAALRRADVVLVNSLADGMNLVVSEAALLGERHPVIILSRTAGAYERFANAVIPLDPRSIDDTSRSLAEALALPESERRSMIETLRRGICETSPSAWLAAQMPTARRTTLHDA